MKKQILSLILSLLAVFAVNSVAAQATSATHASDPRGIGCSDDPLHPIAGKEYTYKAASNQASSNFTFWATKDMNFITTDASGTTSTNMASTMLKSPSTSPTGTDLLTTSSNYATTTATDEVKITWSDAILASTTATAPTFVAVKTDGTCTNNFDAWALSPMVAFTVDVKNIENAAKTTLGYDVTDDQCFDQVRGANYSGGTINYNFGTQTLYFEVVAANFTGSWYPRFNLSTLGNGQSAVIEWDYDMNFNNPHSESPSVLGSTAVVTNSTATDTGVSIYVRVTITNGTYEGIAVQNITLYVDGQNSVGNWDIQNNPAAADPTKPLCDATSAFDQADGATQTLNPRPTVTPVTPNTFVPGNETH